MEEKNKISKVLSYEEQHDLLAVLNDEGWKSVIKLADEIVIDWADQGMNPDMLKMTDSEIGKHLSKFHGMKKGLVSFINTLEYWKKTQERKQELAKKD